MATFLEGVHILTIFIYLGDFNIMSGNGRKKFVSNTAWVIAQHIFSLIISITVVALTARYLGPTAYGKINYCKSFLTFFTSLAGMGIDSLIVSEIIKKPEKEGSYLGTAMVFRLIASFVSYILLLALIAAINPGDRELLIIASFQSLSIIFETYTVLNYWFQIRLKMKVVSIVMIIAISVASVWRIILLVRKSSVEWFALSSAIQSLVCALLIIAVFVRKTDVRLKFSIHDGLSLLKLSYNCIISNISIVIYMEIDKVLLGNMTDAAHVGVYSAAVLLSSYWQFIPSALIESARPIVLAKRKESHEGFINRFQLVLAGVSIIGLLYAVCMTGMGWLVLKTVYGEDYMKGAVSLVILSWASFISMVGSARTIWINGESFYKYDKWFTVSACVINIVLDVVFIKFLGITGAAIATIITYAYEVFIAPLFFGRTRPFLRIYLQSFAKIPGSIEFFRSILLRKTRRN